MITLFERQYISILEDIYTSNESDLRIPCVTLRCDVGKEFPIIKSRRVNVEHAVRNAWWIWVLQSNIVQQLKLSDWDMFCDNTGTIGKAYGYQVAKPVSVYHDSTGKLKSTYRVYDNQIDYVIKELKEYPNSRRAAISLWDVDELRDMNIIPSTLTLTFNIMSDALNCSIEHRSCDVLRYLPELTVQYAVLMHWLSQVLDVKPGILLQSIADAHVYEKDKNLVKMQLDFFRLLSGVEAHEGFWKSDTTYATTLTGRYPDVYNTLDKLKSDFLYALSSKPTLVVNDVIKDFFDFMPGSTELQNYRALNIVTR